MRNNSLFSAIVVCLAVTFAQTAYGTGATLSAARGPLQRVEIEALEPATMTVERVLGEREASARAPLNISSERPSSTAIVLGGANTSGLFGSFFTTDLFIINPHPGTTLKINIFLLPPNTNNIATAPPAGSITLGSLQWAILRNIGTQLGATGGFAILLGVDSSLSSGISMTMSAWGYTSTPGPIGGRYGVNVHGIGTVYQDSLFDGWCVGAEVSSASRTNIGVFNPSSTATLTVAASVYEPQSGQLLQSIPLSVPPASFTQIALSSYVSTLLNGIIWFKNASGSYASYMVVNDNVTNDANFQLSGGW